MASQQSGVPRGADQAGASPAPNSQLSASQPEAAPKAPGYAAFATVGGAAIVFRDLADI